MPAFFGLTPSDKEALILEPFFALMYYGGMSWETYYTFPVRYKQWLIGRINKEILSRQEGGNDIASKGFHHNTSDIRQMTNKTRTSPASARMQRFT